MKYLLLYEKFYKPNKELEEQINYLVNKLLSIYKGGKEFFDALDDQIKSITNENLIINLLKGNSNEYVCSSGEFGDRVYKLWKDGKIKCKGLVIFNGKLLTHNKDVQSYYPSDFNLKDKKFVYVDDSYFSGITVKKIEDYLNKFGSIIKSVNVIYDGSKNKNKKIKSYFRYYDEKV